MLSQFLKRFHTQTAQSSSSTEEIFRDQKQELARVRQLLDAMPAEEPAQDLPRPVHRELIGRPIIWQYAGYTLRDRKSLSELVLPCIESVERNKGSYEVQCLDPSDVAEYLALPSDLIETLDSEGKEQPICTDLVRLALLITYGGISLEPSIYLTDEIPTEILTQDFFLFERLDTVEESLRVALQHHASSYWSWLPEFKVRYLTGFLLASPQHKILIQAYTILLQYLRQYGAYQHPFTLAIIIGELLAQDGNDFPKLKRSDSLPHLLSLSLGRYAHGLRPSVARQQSSIHYFEPYLDDTLEIINYIWRQRTKY